MEPLFEKSVVGPATHAIVIGVGSYAYLPGGRAFAERVGEVGFGAPWTPYAEAAGLAQLSSPPHSALRFARWLLDRYHNRIPSASLDRKPLASLYLLLSEPHESRLTLPGDQEVAVPRASLQNVVEALNGWIDRGDTSPDHLLIFYFCGHGVGSGSITSLLLDDFGKQRMNPLKHALYFDELKAGMDKCAAREQCYFVDACREASPALLENSALFAGEVVVAGGGRQVGTRRYAVYYSTGAGGSAYSRQGQPSLFTESLLKCFEGAGSQLDEDDDDVWVVMAGGNLGYNMGKLLERAALASGAPGQVNASDVTGVFPLHYLADKPKVPLHVRCDPQEATGLAQLSYTLPDESNPVLRPQKEATPWEVEIAEGDYRFFARFGAGSYHDAVKDRYVLPGLWTVNLEVRQ